MNIILDNIEYNSCSLPENYDLKRSDFIKANFNAINYKLDEQNIAGINELLQLPYYYRLIKDIIEVNFV